MPATSETTAAMRNDAVIPVLEPPRELCRL
jgi:hypothetical protein